MQAQMTLDLSALSGRPQTEPLMIAPCCQEDVAAHDHRFFELVYITGGTAFHTLNGVRQPIGTGNYFIIDYGSVHSYSDSRNLSLINCLFLPEVIDETLRGCRSFEALMHSCLLRYYQLAPGQPFANRVFLDDSGRVRQLIEGMLAEYRNRQTGYPEIIRGHLLEIQILTLRSLLADHPLPARSAPVTDAITYISNHYAEHGVLRAYCRDSHFNAQYISRKFRQETGFTITNYLQKIRIEKSCELLAGTELRVTEIAQAVGYENVKHFQQLFSRMLHMSPREYRKLAAAQNGQLPVKSF